MNILGIDIGTTTISAILLDENTGEVKNSVTLKNDSFLESPFAFERIQDPKKIIATVKEAVSSITDGENISSIGVTGQMHGILYLDAINSPVSPLYIWQDLRGNEMYSDSLSYAEYLTKNTSYKASTGFGLTTHFYNLKNGLVPENAVTITTIHDYLVSVLTDTKPVTHSSDAASLGFFDLEKQEFDALALEKVGINPSILPSVIKGTEIAGKTNCDFLKKDIPVSVAIGDNQASFLGSVLDPDTSVLVNVGTGSQVSFITKSLKATKTGEIRPLTDGEYIFVGSSLCGGRAYQILKNFFALTSKMLGGSEECIYEKMDLLSEDIDKLQNPLKVNCEFAGTRENPEKRGFIENISTENLTPTHLICGVLTGVADELEVMYNEATHLLITKPTTLVGSGNGLRKSHIWRNIFSNKFSLNLTLPKHSEEASVGACVFAAAANKTYKNIREAQKSLLGE